METTHTTQPDITMESLTQKVEELQASLNSLQGQHHSAETVLPEADLQDGDDGPQIVTIEEEEWDILLGETESQDVMDDFDSATWDAAIISSIYEGLRDAPIESHSEEKEDFALGQ